MTNENNELAILFVDVSESTRLYEALGDTAAHGLVSECLTLCKEAIGGVEGHVIKSIGDGLMCAFPSADAAVSAACEMQSRLPGLATPQALPLAIQIGLHYGQVLRRDGDVFGDTVNIAARMLEVAAPGQIITTESTVSALSPAQREATRRLDKLPIKGKNEEIAVYEVLWQAGSDRTLMPNRVDSVLAQAGLARLRLEHNGRESIVVLSITLGRDPKSGIRLLDRMASRRHAFIERRKNKFVLIDQSANGTFVSMANGGSSFILRREEMVLTGNGSISFGHSAERGATEVVMFWCEGVDVAASTPTDQK
jgi:class 3 adenylate cyclase